MKSFACCKFFLSMIGVLLFTFAGSVYATGTDFWRKSGNKVTSINHNDWQVILNNYITEEKTIENKITEEKTIENKNSDEVPTINLFNYHAVSSEHKRLLKHYLDTMQAIDPREYSREEQFAYWVNLYNALTVDLILQNYPVKKITKLGPLFSFGPRDEKIAAVAGEMLTLNDIEHKILRPIWQDPRIHYAVNCASFSCPNLSATAFTASNTEALLERAARDYINHPRGLSVQDNKLTLSKIYKWYVDDFGDSDEGVLAHILQYANPALKQRLESFNGDIAYTYDWSLNEPEKNRLLHKPTISKIGEQK